MITIYLMQTSTDRLLMRISAGVVETRYQPGSFFGTNWLTSADTVKWFQVRYQQ